MDLVYAVGIPLRSDDDRFSQDDAHVRNQVAFPTPSQHGEESMSLLLFRSIAPIACRSAMFNILVIVAMSAAVAARSGASLKIDHRVVARDVSFYSGSIVLLVAFFSDGKITWWEVRMYVHLMEGNPPNYCTVVPKTRKTI